MISKTFVGQIEKSLKNIYGDDLLDTTLKNIIDITEQYKENKTGTHSKNEKWSEKDAILITYGDSINKNNEKPLQTLKKFIDEHLKNSISCVHILPFFPYSSDDGFSVIDYTKVNPELGNWNMIESISDNFDLMFDLVVNHISQHSKWFKNYKAGIEPGLNYFIEESPKTDLSDVVRPRNLPLLTEVQTTRGIKHVWTTFSDDQVDLNFKSQNLLVEMLSILLEYASKGARIIRLDAIAFLWKEIGSSCIHLKQTHEVVKLMREVIEHYERSSIILTETNVPNKENLSYFGNNDEAHMVYQFSLPPLLLHALYTSDSTYLAAWAEKLPELTNEQTFFNFTASHDGIGVRPLEGLIPEEDFNDLIEGMRDNGAFINEKRNKDGSSSPYELNITYFDALRKIKTGDFFYHYDRFICSQIIMMTLKGIPAFYIHSLLGTPNYYEGVKRTGMNRSINRRKYQIEEIYEFAKKPGQVQIRIFDKLTEIIKTRSRLKAFHPNGSQEILQQNDSLFIIKRTYGENSVISISNICQKPHLININLYHELRGQIDMISDKPVELQELEPYQTIWVDLK